MVPIDKGLLNNKIAYLPEAILERDKERRSLCTPPCGTEAMSDAVAAQKRPGPLGNPIFGSLRRCSSVVCHSGHKTFVAPCTNLKSGTPNSQFYCLTTPKQTGNGISHLPDKLSVDEDIRDDARPQVLGIWDLRTGPITLGGLLILVEELHAQAIIHRTKIAGICFIGDISHPLPIPDVPANDCTVVKLDEVTCSGSVLLSTLLNLQGMDACYQTSSLSAIKDFVSSHSRSYVTWPFLDNIDKDGCINHAYGTTLFIQRFYGEYKNIPFISTKSQSLRWALCLIEKYITPALPVVVHLKNNPQEQGCSNAKPNEWLKFFQACITQYDVKFILIGDDEVDSQIHNLPNVLITRELGSTLTRDLALIQTSFAFLGMASGFCNMALFSDIPYLIYKNPNHHTEQMALELGEGNRFTFAAPFQKMLRIYETSEILVSEFDNIYTCVKRQAWEKRITNLH